VLSPARPGRVFLRATPTDMRKSFDGLSAVVRDHLKQDPLAGDLFVFRNRRGDRLKLLYWDEDGLAVWLPERNTPRTFARDSRAESIPLDGDQSLECTADLGVKD
jgi:hypothetical protein